LNYVAKNLGPGEEIIYRGHIHGIVYLPGIILCLTVIGAVIGIPMLFLQWLRCRTTLFVVTNRRVVMRVGIFAKSSMEMLTNKVEEVDVAQSIWGRIFNFGTVRLIGVGGSREPFRFLADPGAFRAAVQTSAF
jgi:uncharacterized membrane protein YdbT with pleckstrin-like domain